jgi:hypothetical protein
MIHAVPNALATLINPHVRLISNLKRKSTHFSPVPVYAIVPNVNANSVNENAKGACGVRRCFSAPSMSTDSTKADVANISIKTPWAGLTPAPNSSCTSSPPGVNPAKIAFAAIPPAIWAVETTECVSLLYQRGSDRVK